MKKVLKTMNNGLMLVLALLFVGCAYIGPAYIPAASQKLYKDVIGHEVPAVKIKGANITTVGILKGIDKELDFRKQEYLLKWSFTKEINYGIIDAFSKVSDSVLSLLAFTGPIGAAVGHSIGKKKKRDEDFSAEEVAAIKAEWGRKDPDQAAKDLAGGAA